MNEGNLETKEELPKATCAIILNAKSEVLLIKRENGKWALPSGVGYSKPKHNLSPDQAVCKEVEADLGTQSFQGKRSFSIPVKDSKTTDEIIVFVGKINESEIKPKREVKWMSLEEATREQLAFDHAEIIKKYLV